MAIEFRSSPRPTVGIEWELALVDKTTRDLANRASELFDEVHLHHAPIIDEDRLHKELLRNTVEIVTGICESVPEAIEDLTGTARKVRRHADALGVDLYSAGTHPFAQWSSQLLTPGHRYEELISRTQWWGRQMLIWGLHVHVGVQRRDHVLPIVTAMLQWFPHLQALSASSPMWAGTDTGYASNRAMMFQQLPTAGLPFHFQTWEEYESFVDDELRTGVIEVLNDIRWDVRPSPAYGTVEVRICDGVSTIREMAGLAALMQCLVVDLDQRLDSGDTLPTMPPWHVQENKWRSARYGLEAEIILDAAGSERLVTDDLDDLLDRLTPVARKLDCEAELASVAEIPRRGASYQRQREIAEDTRQDLVAVVDSVVRELEF
ncbi:MAG: glutamate--cysteine ligase [Actinomycetes bacterium]